MTTGHGVTQSYETAVSMAEPKMQPLRMIRLNGR